MLLTPEVFSEAANRAKVKIGRSALNLVNLVWLGMAAAVHRGKSFAFVLTNTLKLLEDQENFYGMFGRFKGAGRFSVHG